MTGRGRPQPREPETAVAASSSLRGLRRSPLVAAIAWWAMPRPTASRSRPIRDRNVLLITIDTLRADALSAYGGRASTPRLDALAARGARFTFAHAHAVVTLPSHTSLLTGTYPYEHGVRDNNGYRVQAGTASRWRRDSRRSDLPPAPSSAAFRSISASG